MRGGDHQQARERHPEAEPLVAPRAFAASREAPWNDLSKGLGREPDATDELAQRVFWLEWRDRLMQRAV